MYKLKSLGIMGGTFDPVHYGHLIAAEYARHEFDLEKVIFMPAARPPHKETERVLDSNHRYEMVRQAIQGNDAFILSDLEMKRAGESYSIDTVRYFLKEYPRAELFFIMGADSLLAIDTWKDYRELVRLCQFVVVTRPGYVIDDKGPAMSGLLTGENLHFLPIPGLDISSSDIRDRVAAGWPVKYLLPSEVEQYIMSNRLYRLEGGF